MPPHRNAAPLYVASRRETAAVTEQFFRQDVLHGLSGDPKGLPAKYFYDAEGSRLFEEITRLPEYYVTRCEHEILTMQWRTLAAVLPKRPLIVELGAGSAQKFRLLKTALGEIAGYIPVDIAPEVIFSEAETLRRDFPELPVSPVVADFTAPFALPANGAAAPVVGFFPGSTIGNFEPRDARDFLARTAETLGPCSMLVLGADLVKDKAVLEAAYNDAQGVTAAFNRNLLTRINRELGGAFTPRLFRHCAFYNAVQSRIEMHLESVRPQQVKVAGIAFAFREGERIHTENSYKYTLRSLQALAHEAGWRSRAVLLDRHSYVSLSVLTRDT